MKSLKYIVINLQHSKRRHQVSMNTHQIPVSLITQEMLNNITYSSCGKTYAVNGTTCHQCRYITFFNFQNNLVL